jgi:hypothetical protein
MNQESLKLAGDPAVHQDAGAGAGHSCEGCTI